MRIIKSAVIATALALTTPVSAHDGHGYGHGRGHHRHHGWHDHRPHFDSRHHGHPWVHPGRRHFYSRYYYAPYPAYAYAVPAPGVHIVVPNFYIPLR